MGKAGKKCDSIIYPGYPTTEQPQEGFVRGVRKYVYTSTRARYDTVGCTRVCTDVCVCVGTSTVCR